MAKKGQKTRKYTLEQMHCVLTYAERNSFSKGATKFNIPHGTIATWSYKKRNGTLFGLGQGNPNSKPDIEKQLEILKKYIEFSTNRWKCV